VDRSTAVAIVGGGIMGASLAYHLAARGQRQVTVFEREPLLGTGSTGKCAGGVRLQFSTAANVAMSRLSIAALERFEAELGEPVDFRQNGYLFAIDQERELETFRENARRQRELGVPVELWTPEQARELVPDLAIDDLVGASFCARDGIASPHAIVQGYARRARELGARFCTSSPVSAIEVERGRVRGLHSAGERWTAEVVVNAAGAWAAEVGRMAGVEVPVQPYRRMVFTTHPMEWIPDNFPMLIDWGSGVYMHPESGGMLMGESDRKEPPSFDQTVDWDFLAQVSEHAARRVPRMAEARLRSGWAGLYEVSPDHNAIIGPVPEVEGFFCANGFSGHGMMHAPAVGQVLAEWLTEGRPLSLDMSAYAIERFRTGALVPEHNVI
jgi:sarcosine oxidase subunit beta